MSIDFSLDKIQFLDDDLGDHFAVYQTLHDGPAGCISLQDIIDGKTQYYTCEIIKRMGRPKVDNVQQHVPQYAAELDVFIALKNAAKGAVVALKTYIQQEKSFTRHYEVELPKFLKSSTK